MKGRAFDLILLVVIVIGGLLAWQAGRERSRLSAEHARLARITGDLPIVDRSRVHILALDTGDPMHFAWRVYYPANYSQILASDGSWSNSWSSSPSEFIGRVRFREDKQGRLQVYRQFWGGSSTTGLPDQALAEQLHGRWDKLRVEQLGSAGVTILEPDQTLAMLRLTLPEGLRDVAGKTHPSNPEAPHDSLVFELKLGPKATKP